MIESKGRMIRKDISNSKGFAKLSKEAQVLFCLIIPHLNAHGKQNGSPHFIKGEICPRIDYLDIPQIIKCLKEITINTNLKWFEYEGLFYLHSLSWNEHQELEKNRLGNDRLPSFKSGRSRRQVADKSGRSRNLVAHEVEVEVKEEVEVKDKDKDNAETSSAVYPGGSANNGDYTISTPLQKVVVGWKMITGHEKTDRGWDKLNWGRVAKTARGLLDYFGGDHKQAINCCEDVYKQMLKNKLSCTIETVSKHASEWKLKGENEHN